MGYAQYFLNNYREALDYFSKARELNPEDEDTPKFHPSVQYGLAVNQTSERILELVCRKRRKAVWHDESEIHGGS
ncbi:tetratricopeptide repeat protein [Bacteroides uniformis]|nr:tetratricopeptide repeat protein [Bacteroides uniformis]